MFGSWGARLPSAKTKRDPKYDLTSKKMFKGGDGAIDKQIIKLLVDKSSGNPVLADVAKYMKANRQTEETIEDARREEWLKFCRWLLDADDTRVIKKLTFPWHKDVEGRHRCPYPVATEYLKQYVNQRDEIRRNLILLRDQGPGNDMAELVTYYKYFVDMETEEPWEVITSEDYNYFIRKSDDAPGSSHAGLDEGADYPAKMIDKRGFEAETRTKEEIRQEDIKTTNADIKASQSVKKSLQNRLENAKSGPYKERLKSLIQEADRNIEGSKLRIGDLSEHGVKMEDLKEKRLQLAQELTSMEEDGGDRRTDSQIYGELTKIALQQQKLEQTTGLEPDDIFDLSPFEVAEKDVKDVKEKLQLFNDIPEAERTNEDKMAHSDLKNKLEELTGEKAQTAVLITHTENQVAELKEQFNSAEDDIQKRILYRKLEAVTKNLVEMRRSSYNIPEQIMKPSEEYIAEEESKTEQSKLKEKQIKRGLKRIEAVKALPSPDPVILRKLIEEQKVLTGEKAKDEARLESLNKKLIYAKETIAHASTLGEADITPQEHGDVAVAKKRVTKYEAEIRKIEDTYMKERPTAIEEVDPNLAVMDTAPVDEVIPVDLKAVAEDEKKKDLINLYDKRIKMLVKRGEEGNLIHLRSLAGKKAALEDPVKYEKDLRIIQQDLPNEIAKGKTRLEEMQALSTEITRPEEIADIELKKEEIADLEKELQTLQDKYFLRPMPAVPIEEDEIEIEEEVVPIEEEEEIEIEEEDVPIEEEKETEIEEVVVPEPPVEEAMAMDVASTIDSAEFREKVESIIKSKPNLGDEAFQAEILSALRQISTAQQNESSRHFMKSLKWQEEQRQTKKALSRKTRGELAKKRGTSDRRPVVQSSKRVKN